MGRGTKRSGGEQRGRFSGNQQGQQKKRKYYSEGARAGEIRGKGIWFTCERRKEAKAVFEAYDLLNEAADHLYPETSAVATQATEDANNQGAGDAEQAEGSGEVEESIEDQIARELEGMQSTVKGRVQKNKSRFSTVKTNTECLIWVSCAPPCDPVELVRYIVANLQNGAAVRTKHLQRMTPVSATCHADPVAVKNIAYRVLQSTFAPADYTQEQRDSDSPIRYRIEPNLRNHSGTFNRDLVTQLVGDVIRDLTNPRFQYPVYQKPETEDEQSESADNSAEDSATDTVKDSAKDQAIEGADNEGPANVAATAAEEEKPTLNATEAPLPDHETSDVTDSSTQQTQQAETGESTLPADQNPADSADAPAPQRPVLPGHRRRAYVDLKNATHTVMVTILKGVASMSIVTGYDEGRKFNIQMLAEQQVAKKSQQAEESEKTKAEDAKPSAPEAVTHASEQNAETITTEVATDASHEVANESADVREVEDPAN